MDVKVKIRNGLKWLYPGLFFVLFALCIVAEPAQMIQRNEDRITVGTSIENSHFKAARQELKNGELWEQNFTPDKTMLDSISFNLYNVMDDMTGTLAVEITDGERLLWEKKIPAEEVRGERYQRDFRRSTIQLKELNVRLNKHTRYTLRVMLTDNSGTTPTLMVIKDSANKFEEARGIYGLIIGGRETVDVLAIAAMNYYTITNFYTIFSALGILLLAFMGLRKAAPAAYRAGGCFVLAVLPVIVFACFEWTVNGFIAVTNIIVLSQTFLILYLVYIIFLGLFGHRVGAFLFWLTGNLLSLADYEVLTLRGSNLSFDDIMSAGTAATVANQYAFSIPVRYVCACMIGYILIPMIMSTGRTILPLKLEKRRGGRLIVRGLLCVIGTAGTIVVLQSFEAVSFNNWDTEQNYQDFGWLYTNIAFTIQGVAPPDDYSERQAQELLATAANEENTLNNQQPEHLIVVMNESFSDLTVLGNLKTSEDAMPYYRSLEENAEKGYLAVSVIGGGTCNTEWEVLAGGNRQLLSSGALMPYSFMYQHAGDYNNETLCSALEAKGYSSLAIHPYPGTNYHRDRVYSTIGFDQFLDLSDFDDPVCVRDFPDDRSNYEMLEEQTEKAKGNPLFVFNVTMQNHGGYEDAKDLQTTVRYENGEDDVADTYLSLIKMADNALEELIEYYSKQDERTMIVFFGDHQPQMSDSFYEETLWADGKDDASGDSDSYEAEKTGLKYVVPYLIWTNYSRTTRNVPYMSANYFGAYIKQQANIELSNYDKFLLSKLKEYPVIGRTGVYDHQYQFSSYSNLTDEASEILNQIAQVQYYHFTTVPQ